METATSSRCAVTATFASLVLVVAFSMAADRAHAVTRETSQTVQVTAQGKAHLVIETSLLVLEPSEAEMRAGYLERLGDQGIILRVKTNDHDGVQVLVDYLPGPFWPIRRADLWLRLRHPYSLLPEYATIPVDGLVIYSRDRAADDDGRGKWDWLQLDVMITNLLDYEAPGMYYGVLVFTAITN